MIQNIRNICKEYENRYPVKITTIHDEPTYTMKIQIKTFYKGEEVEKTVIMGLTINLENAENLLVYHINEFLTETMPRGD